MNLYPLKFEPLFQERIWGGRALETRLHKLLPTGKKIGESWEISDHSSAPSVVRNGWAKGQTLAALLLRDRKEILGSRLASEFKSFPLLIKFLDANDKLSIQVHPDDVYALKNENDFGKTESWVVVYAEPGAKLLCGLKRPLSRGEVEQGISDHTLPSLLNEFEVSTGDVVFVPAGTIHAIESGVLIYEVQESSNVTYRLYDWGRVDGDGKPRALHISKSLAVANLTDVREPRTKPNHELLLSCRYFSIEKRKIDSPWKRETAGRFEVITSLKGSGEIRWEDGSETLAPGETILVPAAVGHYSLYPVKNDFEFLLTYVPHAAEPLTHSV